MISKKRCRIFGITLILFSLMIINSYCVYSDDIETYNTSRPIIQVSYNEYPVTVTDFSLKDSLNGVWYIESITDLEDRTVFNFTVNFFDDLIKKSMPRQSHKKDKLTVDFEITLIPGFFLQQPDILFFSSFEVRIDFF